VLKKVLVTLLGLFGASRSDSAPGFLCPPWPTLDMPIVTHYSIYLQEIFYRKHWIVLRFHFSKHLFCSFEINLAIWGIQKKVGNSLLRRSGEIGRSLNLWRNMLFPRLGEYCSQQSILFHLLSSFANRMLFIQINGIYTVYPMNRHLALTWLIVDDEYCEFWL